MIGRGRIAQSLLEAENKLPPVKGFGRAAIGRSAILHNVAMSGPPGAGSSASSPGIGRASFSGHSAKPTPEEDKLEEKIEKLNLNTDHDTLPRKDYGTAGRKLSVVTNYIKVRFNDSEIYQYHVKYEPPIDSKYLRFKLLEDHLTNVRAWRFDGAILYTGKKLPETNSYTSVLETTGETVAVKCVFTKTLSLEDCTPLLNIIFRSILSKLKYTRIGKNLYDPQRAIQIPKHKLELWPGYVTSVSQLDGGFMLQTNVSHKMLRTDTVMDMLLEIHHSHAQNFQSVVMKEIVGNVVMTRYNNKTYRVDDVIWDENPRSTFEDRRGNKIQYFEYYKNQYNITIRDCSQPLLLHRMKPKRGQPEREERLVYLIPELCAMTGLSQSTMDDFMVRKDIVSHTRLDPRDRVRALKGFLTNVKDSPEAMDELRRWNLYLDEQTLEVEARNLDPECIVFGGTDKYYTVNDKADFSQATLSKPPITPVSLDNWLLVYCQKDQQRARELVSCMKSRAAGLGMRVGEAATLPLRDDRTETYIKAITANLSEGVQLVVTIVPTERDDRYNAIKQLCYIDMPVGSQVIKSKTLAQSQKLRSVVQKIMLQIIAKLGGELWACSIPMKGAMVVGIDTYHDPTSRAGSSYTGFVCTMNQLITQFHSQSRQEDRGQEFSSCLQNLMTAALQAYREKNNELPNRIIIFRDGTSEGQFNMVTQYEIPQFEAAFAHLESSYKPQLVVVVVQKRIRTRMFVSEGDPVRGRVINPPPGTVLDHTVTSDHLYDFYLVSQHVGKGTVTPSHYVIVHDTSTLKPDHIQKLAYKLTHMYWNWPGTVRVPSVCLYAHKIAYMHGQHLHRPSSNLLSDRLFYL